jgi:hypothetical protein
MKMVRAVNLAIPPQLQEQYLQVINPQQRSDLSDFQLSLSGHARYPRPPDERSFIQKRADLAAEWLALRFAKWSSKKAMVSFIRDRSNEMLAGVFNPEYWIQFTNEYDDCVKVQFESNLNPNHIPEPYRDPLRRASRTTPYRVEKYYPLPAPQTGLPYPSPGWYGDVQNTQYELRYVVNRRFQFGTTEAFHYLTYRPLFVKFDWTIDAYASFRGNRIWLYPGARAEATNTPGETRRYDHDYLLFLQARDIHKIPTNPAATPWAQSVGATSILDCYTQRHWNAYWNKDPDSFGLRVSMSPISSHGYYFSRNDSCGAWFDCNASAYIARTS